MHPFFYQATIGRVCFHLPCIKLGYVVALVIFGLQLDLNILRTGLELFPWHNVGSEQLGDPKKIYPLFSQFPTFWTMRDPCPAAWPRALESLRSPLFFPAPVLTFCSSGDLSVLMSCLQFLEDCSNGFSKDLKCLGGVFSTFASLLPPAFREHVQCICWRASERFTEP